MMLEAVNSPRRLTFPTDSPIGWIDIRPWQDIPSAGALEDIVDPAWYRLCPAQGEVEIPAGMEVRLRLNKRANLTGLQRLEAYSIQDLILRNTDVSDEDLKEIRHLRGLRTLDLWSTPVTPKGLRQLESLEKLEQLAWSSKRLERLVDFSLASLVYLKNLKILWLSAPRLEEAEFRHLANLSSLHTLHLFTSELEVSGLQHLAMLPSLRCLAINDGVIDEQALKSIGRLKQLEELDLSRASSFAGEGLAHLRTLGHLKQLILRQVFHGLEGKHIKALEFIPSLESICVTSLDLGGEALAILAHLPNLKALDISGDYQMKPAYSRKAIAELSKATRLEKLNLSYNQVENGDFSHFGELPNVQSLELAGTNLASGNLHFVRNMTNLRKLDLSETSIKDDDLKHLTELTRLEDLRLENTQVLDVESLGNLPGLNTLFVGGMREEWFETASLASITRSPLRVLWVTRGKTPVGSFIESFTELYQLSLYGMRLLTDDVRRISNLIHLRDINLMESSIDQPSDLYLLAGLPHLQCLTLSHPSINDTFEAPLSTLRQVERLSLWNTSFTTKVLGRLQTALPNTDVLGGQ